MVFAIFLLLVWPITAVGNLFAPVMRVLHCVVTSGLATSADDRNTTSCSTGSEYWTSHIIKRTFLPSRGFRIVDVRVQTAVLAVSVKPEVFRTEVALRPSRYHAATCISPSLMHLLDFRASFSLISVLMLCCRLDWQLIGF